MESDVEEFLEHFGVKGMKWGVRNEDKPTGRDNKARTEAYKKELSSKKPLSAEQKYKNLVDSQKKFLAKVEKSDESLGVKSPKDDGKTQAKGEKGWRPTGNQVAIAAVGAVFIASAIYGHKVSSVKAGDPVGPTIYNSLVSRSKMRAWSNGYVKESSFLQEEFTLPKGHTFHRISMAAESTFNSVGGTYATHSIEDYNRYATGFTKELGSKATLHHVTFQATDKVRVPSLTTRLDALKEHMSDHKSMLWGNPPGDNEVLREYESMCGGNWSSGVAEGFFKKLSSRGYHAIVDDMDAGVIGESPLVIFDTSVFGPKKASVISKEDLKAAGKALTEISNRKLS